VTSGQGPADSGASFDTSKAHMGIAVRAQRAFLARAAESASRVVYVDNDRV
jgi:hypothetical protein